MEIQKYAIAKKSGYEERVRKDLKIKVNGRSADYILPSFATGCEKVQCGYCYTNRNRSFGNPMTKYTNLDEILESSGKFYQNLPQPKIPNQTHAESYSIDVGENSDCLNLSLTDYTNYTIKTLIKQGWFPTFATKIPMRARYLDPVERDTARVRISLMPQKISTILEPGSNLIADRLKAAQIIYDKGFQCQLNFSPVVCYKGWLEDYLELFLQIDAALSEEVKAQLQCEIIFLTSSPKTHAMNLLWNPEAEEYLWTPNIQEYKTNQRGDSSILRYKHELKAQMLTAFKTLLGKVMPYCKVRYAF